MDNTIEISTLELLESKFGLVGRSESIMRAIHLIVQAAPTDLSVLITGATGTGKEVVANAIHGLSRRKKSPFVSVNCAAIPETLLESELFGNEKGAFTGATDQRIGFFETAHNGTIFLDEIGDMPFNTQVKLLRILETGEYSRLGSSAVRKVDVRVIAATNKNLEDEVSSHNFRQDLYFRLKSVHIKLPSLAERYGDVAILAKYFANKTCKKLNCDFKGFSDNAISILEQLPWKGNIRELKNLIETVITLEHTDYLSAEILRRYISPALPPSISKSLPEDRALVPFKTDDEPQKFELEIIFRSLLQMQNNLTLIADELHSLNYKYNMMDSKLNELLDNSINISKNAEIVEDRDNNLNLAETEKQLIITAIKRFNGNRRLAAKELGISERTLYRKLAEHKIN